MNGWNYYNYLNKIKISGISSENKVYSVGKAESMCSVVVGIVSIARQHVEHEPRERASRYAVPYRLHHHVAHQPTQLLFATLAYVVVITDHEI